jgi:undecaprenyl-diphosphatase
MTLFQSLVLGIVEGLTEFLPVSSTGHLILTGHFLGIEDSAAVDAFDVVIQSGAIFAVIWHYRTLLGQILRGALKRQSDALNTLISIFLAFCPAAVIGLLFHKKIKALLFGVMPVAGALVVGGIAMILIERRLWARATRHFQFTADRLPGPVTSLKIGFFQCLALWPGVSRSMATILGGRLCGLNAARAAEFSFLLAIPTLLAAGALDTYKHGSELWITVGPGPIIVGLVSSFAVSLVVIRVFLEFLRSYSLEAFGWYRIAAGLLIWIFA